MLIQHGNFSKNALVLLENCKICKKIVDVRCVKEKKKIGMMGRTGAGNRTRVPNVRNLKR